MMEAGKIGQIQFTVPGNPFGKQRPKQYKINQTRL